MRTVLTIDWDFFVPLPDLPGGDTRHHVLDAWRDRDHLRDQITTTGAELDFWNRVHLGGYTGPLYVSDSHAAVWSLLEAFGPDRVVNVDQHHDCCEAPPGGRPDGIYANNWAKQWLLGRRRRKLRWVKPAYGQEDYPAKTTPRAAIRTWPCGLGTPGLVAVHACRSGGWTPPWLDAAFIAFVQASGMPLEVISRHAYDDPLEPRSGP